MAKSNTISIPVVLPASVNLSQNVLEKAKTAAQAVVDLAASEASMLALLDNLEKKGFKVTPSQWAALQGGGKRTLRTRVVLSSAQRKQLVKRAKEGATGAALANEFGVSLATVNNIKKAGGISVRRAPKASKRGKRG